MQAFEPSQPAADEVPTRENAALPPTSILSKQARPRYGVCRERLAERNDRRSPAREQRHVFLESPCVGPIGTDRSHSSSSCYRGDPRTPHLELRRCFSTLARSCGSVTRGET